MSKLLKEGKETAHGIIINNLATKIELELINPYIFKSTCYAVTDNNEYKSILFGLFRTRNDANNHMVRLAINATMKYYSEYTKNNEVNVTEEGFKDTLTWNLVNFQIIMLDHIDINQPVYALKEYSDMTFTCGLIQFLTNSLEEWKTAVLLDQETVESILEFKEECTIKIDPELSALITN